MGTRLCLLPLFACMMTGLFTPSPTRACNVPVFRYALERWPADLYDAVLFHEGPLTAELEQLAKMLRRTDERGQPIANLRLTTVDLHGDLDEATQQLWKSQPRATTPWLVVRYPSALGLERPMWAGTADQPGIASLLDSPIRQELARRLLAGHSNIWLVLESGQAEQDRQVVESLERELKKLSSTIKLPDESAQPGGVLTLPENQGEGVLSKVPLRIDFSVLRISRRDPAEWALLANIVQTDDGLAADTGVVVLPVFGRGRALRAFPGTELDAGTIAGVEEFLCGACSCSVKAQNPGMDLLIAANWQAAMAVEPRATKRETAESDAPTLVAIPRGQASPPTAANVAIPPAQSPATAQHGSAVKLAVAAAAMVVAVMIALVVLARRSKWQRLAT